MEDAAPRSRRSDDEEQPPSRVAAFKAAVGAGARWAVATFDARDAHCYVGATVATVGIWGFDPRVAVICLGAFLAWIGVRR